MNAPQLLAAAVLMLVLTPLAAAAQTRTNAPAPQTTAKAATKVGPAPVPAGSFEAFKNVPDRNIFNSRRFAGRTSETPSLAPRRDPVVETFSLLGTLDYPKGPVAFFEGSSSGYRKAVKVDESIGGCKVTAIESALVRLEANGKPVELQVGYMMRREDDGEWKTREAERIFEPTYTSSYSSSSSSPFGSGSSSSFGSSSFSSSRDPRYSSSSGSGRDSRYSSSGRDSRSGSNESPADSAQRRIREQDRNGDGKVSMEEADSRLRDRFRDMDRNGDRQVDAEEYTAYYASRMGGSSSGTPSTSTFNNPSSSATQGNFGSTTSSGSSSTPPSSSPSSGASGESDLLRRLMEQRARENR